MKATDIAHLLSGRAEDVARHLLPFGARQGREWCVGSINGEAGSSLKVIVDGAKQGVWRDFGGSDEDRGDLIGLWKRTKDITLEQACQEAVDWLGVPQDQRNGRSKPAPRTPAPKVPDQRWTELQSTMRAGSDDELDSLAALRGLPTTAGLILAAQHGHLFFGHVHDRGERHLAWILTDGSRRNAQARRLDGGLWQFKEGSKPGKSKTIWGTDPKWPMGLNEATTGNTLLVEGGPDLLAAWHLIAVTGKEQTHRPVAMFGVSNEIHAEALSAFKGQQVHLFPHNDDNQAGQKGAIRWKAQLVQAGARVEVYDFSQDQVKDLNELVARPDAALPMLAVKKRVLEPEEGEEIQAPQKPKGATARPITSYAYPSDDDPNMLLGSDDYLGRGGGLLFVSHAGAGKSSWAMDACMMWALGRAWMQIKSHAPRKILIIQAEDSDRYVGKIFTSFAHVNKLTPEDLALLTKNCIIIRLKGVSGPAFFAALKELTDEHQPDLVVINPLYLYADGDITRSEFAQPFLLALDAANKAERWAYILIHHTGKPAARDKSGKRAEVEDWESAYMGFGSSYLANWPRATILLEPVPGAVGRYQIKLGKGGLNAGVTKEVEQGAGFRLEPHTRISIRHSRDKMPIDGKERPVYYWEIDDEGVSEEPAKGKGGRPSKYKIADFMRFIPATREMASPAPLIYRSMGNASGIPLSSFADLLFRAANDGEIVLTDVAGKGPCYHCKKE